MTICGAGHCCKNELNNSVSQSNLSARSLSGAATKRGLEVDDRSSANTLSARRATSFKLSMGPARELALRLRAIYPRIISSAELGRIGDVVCTPGNLISRQP